MFTKKKKKQQDVELSPSKISIFIKNEVHQDGQHQEVKQEQKQDKKDESQNGCMAWIKGLCK